MIPMEMADEGRPGTAAKEDGMHKGRILRLLSLFGLTSVLAVLASSAAIAAPSTPTYCLDGRTTTLPVTMTLGGLSRDLPQSLADTIISSSEDHSTFFLVVVMFGGIPRLFFDWPPDDPGSVPGVVTWNTHSIRAGACTGRAASGFGPGSEFMCGAGYGPASGPDYVAGKTATAAYLAGDPGRHYAFFVQGNLDGPQLAQAPEGTAPAGSFYCALPAGLKVEPIMGADGKQMLADTMGALYLSSFANLETIGHPAYRVTS